MLDLFIFNKLMGTCTYTCCEPSPCFGPSPCCGAPLCDCCFCCPPGIVHTGYPVHVAAVGVPVTEYVVPAPVHASVYLWSYVKDLILTGTCLRVCNVQIHFAPNLKDLLFTCRNQAGQKGSNRLLNTGVWSPISLLEHLQSSVSLIVTTIRKYHS